MPMVTIWSPGCPIGFRPHALALEAELAAGTGAFGDRQCDATADRIDLDLAAEHRLVERDRYSGVDVVTLAVEDRVWTDLDLDQGVSWFRAARSGVTFALEAERLPSTTPSGTVKSSAAPSGIVTRFFEPSARLEKIDLQRIARVVAPARAGEILSWSRSGAAPGATGRPKRSAKMSPKPKSSVPAAEARRPAPAFTRGPR